MRSSERTFQRMHRAKLKLLFKLAVSLAAVVWLVVLVDWKEFIEALRACDPLLLLVVEGALALLVLLSSFKWQLLLRLKGLEFPLWYLYRVYFVANFFNNFLPTSIGGDAARVYYTVPSRRKRSETGAVAVAGCTGGAGDTGGPAPTAAERAEPGWEVPAAAVIVERLTGVVALLAICYIAAGLQVVTGSRTDLFVWVFAGGTLCLVAGSLAGRFLLRRWSASGRRVRFRLPAALERVVESLLAYRRPKGALRPVWVVSFAFQSLYVVAVFILAHAVGAQVALAPLFVVVPLQALATVLPISINGIGVNEAAYVILFAAIGVPVEEALLAGIVMRALVIPFSIIGGAIHFMEKSGSRPDVQSRTVIQETGR